jgi:hypothetical protein
MEKQMQTKYMKEMFTKLNNIEKIIINSNIDNKN